jgi:hypothetical protein
MRSSRLVRPVLAGVLMGALFAACAQGNQLGVGGGTTGAPTGSGTITGAGGGGGSVPEAGPGIGAPCPDGTCAEGTCTLIGSTAYCTTACPPACPTGTYCSVINGNALCIPDLGQECGKCSTAADCKQPSDACLKAPPGDTFCARDCSVDGLCPNGFTCLDMSAAEHPDAGSGDAGADGGHPDAGVDAGHTDAGPLDAGHDAGDAGGSDAGAPVPSAPDKWCVPDDGESCPCNPGRDGVTHDCAVANANGACSGMETCNGKSSAWMGCTAMTPVAEVCNGLDDNCNGQVDEGDPNSLCAAKGAPPPHASWACAGSKCGLGACNPGWTAYPAGGGVAAGCACQVDGNAPNQTCATAKSVGTVTDVGGTPLTIQGTLSSDTDVDVYTFNTTDTDETTTNSYHVTITFTQPSPNNEFVMDVIRGTACSDTPTGAGVNISSYDWCVNASNATAGEAPCGPTDVHHCASHDSQYFVRVHRAAGVTGTCTPYQITVTGGGGTCDLTQTCM